MPSRSFAAVVSDPELMAEVRDRSKKTLTTHRPVLDANEVALAAAEFRTVVEGHALPDAAAQAYGEAIVLLNGRPSLLVRDDSFEEPEFEYWKSRLNPHRAVLESTLRSVGRVELTGHSTYEWVGTAWVIGERLVVTNRHVANIFAQQQGQGFVFRPSPLGGAMTARIDFKEEYQTGAVKEVSVTRVLYVAPAALSSSRTAMSGWPRAVAPPTRSPSSGIPRGTRATARTRCGTSSATSTT